MRLPYRNPVWPGYFADPFVLRTGGAYYAYGTGGPERHGMQPDGRMFPLLRSEDLVRWEYLGGALNSLGDPAMPAYWAPEVAERDGRFNLYYSAGGLQGEGQQLRVATADNAEGPFEDNGRVLMPGEPFSIDAHPFHDPATGRWHLFFAKDFFDGRAGTALAVVPLADDMVSVAGPVSTVMRAQWDWQIYERDRFWYGRIWDAWHTLEGPTVLVHEGRYYCLYSGGSWQTPEYGVGFCVADCIDGPWVDVADADGPAVLRCVPGVVPGPGHNSVTVAPDGRTEMIVYHAWDLAGTARRLCIDPLLWTQDGPRADGPSTGTRTLELAPPT